MKKVMSLLLIFSLVFAIGFVLAEDIGVSPTGVIAPEHGFCLGAGGTWETFNNGCVDSCDYVRNPSGIMCTQAITDGCECGENKCWNGESCEDNEILIGGCGAVLPELRDECCVNSGYEVWDTTLNECIRLSQPNERVCCKFLISPQTGNVTENYEFVSEERCSGSNKEIVDNSYCKKPRESPVQESQQERKAIAIQKVIQTRNRLQAMEQNGECPPNCVCNGNVMKCRTKNGTKEMVIKAGESGKTIIMVKNSEVKTMAKIYQADDGEVFGVFKGEQTKRIILPDEARERIKEKMKERIKENQRERKQIMLEDEEMELNEDGQYEFQARKRAKLFWVIPVKERVNTQVDAETGVVVKSRHSWWGFLARDVREDVSEE